MSEKQPSWPAGTDAAERVRHVALTRTTPRNAGWIAAEADVSRDTAVKYLSRMADQGDLEIVETADGTCYKPDPVTQFLDEVRDFAEAHSHEELTAELRNIADEIDRWKREYGVESPAELRQSVGDDDLSVEQRRERVDIVEEWECDVEMREAIRLAIGLKDSLTELGTGTGTDPGYASDSQPQEG